MRRSPRAMRAATSDSCPLGEWGSEPAVDASLQLGQFDLHVDRRRQLGVPNLQRAEFRNLAWFDAART